MNTQELKNVNAELLAMHDRARAVALATVEALAREVLRKCPTLAYYIMAMGTASFVEKGTGDMLDLNAKPCMDQLDTFLAEWDDDFKLTGEPMIFTADGPVKREW